MAKTGAIAAVGQATLAMLRDGCPRPEFAGADFALTSAAGQDATPSLGVTLFLYRVSASAGRRSGRASTGEGCRRPPVLVDLHYLLSAWAATAEKQQRLLGWCIRAIEDVAILPATLLNEGAAPEHDTFRADETISLVPDPVSLTDLFNVWELAGKPRLPASATYVARQVAIDRDREEAGGEPVRLRRFDLHAPGEA